MTLCDSLLQNQKATLDEMFPQGQDRSTERAGTIGWYEPWSLTILHEITHAWPSICRDFLVLEIRH
jgi:hypothetical protein